MMLQKMIYEPKISIITVVYNGSSYVEQCILSVLGQDYPNIEYIVIDGKSTDNTMNIVEKYKNKIDAVVSEVDDGIADAMNKGVRIASGEFVFFLNSDDYFVSNSVLNEVVSSMPRNARLIITDIYFGVNRTRKVPRGFTPMMNVKTGIFHQGAICKKELFTQFGYFSTKLSIAFDFEFFLRLYRGGVNVFYIPLAMAMMRDVGISSNKDWNSLKHRFTEEKSSFMMNTNNILCRGFYRLYWYLYIGYRFFINRLPANR